MNWAVGISYNFIIFIRRVGGCVVNKSTFSKVLALIALLAVSAFYVFLSPASVLADASVSTSNVQTWGSGGLISFNISGVSTGEIINVTISTTGTILSAYDNMGSTVLVYGETATCAFTVYDPSISYYQIAVEGVNISGLSASVWVTPAEVPAEPEQPAEQPAAEEPAAEEPAAEEPAAEPQAAAVQIATITEATEATEEAVEEEGGEETAPTETTVPRVIMDAAGNLIVVTPTPTSFPRMESNNVELRTNVGAFPVKPVIGGLVIIAILGARFVILKTRGLRGKQLAIEFIPTVGEIYDRAQFKKSQKRLKEKMEKEQKAKSAPDGTNSASAKAAEAAREAQIARAEFAKAAQERKAAAAAAGTPTARSGKQPAKPQGIKTDPGFKFTAPTAKPSISNGDANAPSPFKPSGDAKKEHEMSPELQKLRSELDELRSGKTTSGDGTPAAPTHKKMDWKTKAPSSGNETKPGED